MYSICIKCGQDKLEYFDKCDACNFQPESDRDIALSLILSDEIFKDAWQTGEFNFPRDKDELILIANMLKRGEKFQIEEKAVSYVISVVNEIALKLNRLSWTKLIFVYFLPGALIFGYAVYVIFKAYILIFNN